MDGKIKRGEEENMKKYKLIILRLVGVFCLTGLTGCATKINYPLDPVLKHPDYHSTERPCTSPYCPGHRNSRDHCNFY